MISDMQLYCEEELDECFFFQVEFTYSKKRYVTHLVHYFSRSHRPNETALMSTYNHMGTEVTFPIELEKQMITELMEYVKQHSKYRLLFLMDVV